MSKAIKMFKELEYFLRTDYEGNLIKNDDYIHYDRHSSNVVEHVTFHLANNPENGFFPHYATSKARQSACGWKMKCVDITPELHLAINQQMKELEWLKEVK